MSDEDDEEFVDLLGAATTEAAGAVKALKATNHSSGDFIGVKRTDTANAGRFETNRPRQTIRKISRFDRDIGRIQPPLVMHIRPHHAARGLKSNRHIRDLPIALRAFRLMLEMVKDEEEELGTSQELLGDACKELREAYGINQEQLAREGSFSVTEIRTMERRASSESAVRYLRALRSIP